MCVQEHRPQGPASNINYERSLEFIFHLNAQMKGNSVCYVTYEPIFAYCLKVQQHKVSVLRHFLRLLDEGAT